MNRLPLVAVIGDAVLPGNDRRIGFAEAVGAMIIEKGWKLVTGGMGGVMESASRGARNSSAWTDGRIVSIIPGWNPDSSNKYADIVIPTGLDHGRNLLVAQSDAIVAVGGGAGTLSEIAIAWMMFRLIVALRGEGWSGKLADQRIDDRTRYPGIPDDRVYGVDSPEEAIIVIGSLLPMYSRRHTGISAGIK